MSASPASDQDVPIWARAEAFPPAPEGYGWLDSSSKAHPCADLDGLLTAVRDDPKGEVTLVWSPENSRMVLPEELPAAAEAIVTARKRWVSNDLAKSKTRLSVAVALFVASLIWITWPQRHDLIGVWSALRHSAWIGLLLLGLLIFGFIPWYQARKALKGLGRRSDERMAETVAVIRFETWLERQKAPVTGILMGLISLVWLAQLFSVDSISAAGLMKDRYLAGEWWRLFTAPLLHAGWIHFLMNGAALLYLGKRLEVFARWPHVMMVFLFAALVGGETTARLVSAPSVGASGGLMGWLGFLLVFETLHGRLVPSSARRRLLAGVILTAAIGLAGYRFIDNAAHAGGLAAGLLYALIVFPKSSSSRRPRSTVTDWLGGGLALIVVAASAAWAVSRMLSP